MIDTLPLGEIGGQHAPLDPPFGHRKDGIEYCPHTQGARSSTAFGGGDQIFDPLPFLVCQVAWIYFFVHIPILHNPRRLFRQALTRLCTSQRTRRRSRARSPATPTAPHDLGKSRRSACGNRYPTAWRYPTPKTPACPSSS